MYLCGDCQQRRQEEHIEMVEHSKERFGRFPICTDKNCSINNVNPEDRINEMNS
jgi:hypothetical protein